MIESIFTRGDTFTVAGNGTTVDTSMFGASGFSIQVKGTGAAATAWNVVLEGSINNSNFTTILTNTDVTGDGVVLFSGAQNYPCRFFRSRVVSITLGSATDVVVRILGRQWKREAGTFTLLATTNQNLNVNGQIIGKGQADGSTITQYNNNSLLHTSTDTAITGNLRAGISLFSNNLANSAPYTDDFEAADLSPTSKAKALGK